jgi:phycocyanobilin lyase subunit alpha
MLDDFESLEPTAAPSGSESLTVEEAIANLHHPDLSLRYYASWWLGRFRVREPAAIDGLITLLGDEGLQTELGGYPLRRNAARALGKLGDLRAVPPLIECLNCPDFYVREAAAQALEMLRDPRGVSGLIKLLDGGLAAAVEVPGKPHLVQPYDAILEALGTLGATEAIELIKPFLDHAVPRVQYAAARALYQLTQNSVYGDRLVQALQGPDLQLRRSALMDLGAIGYVPSIDAIGKTLAENSIKLIALKGILEHNLVKENFSESSALSDSTIRVMALMDSLL